MSKIIVTTYGFYALVSEGMPMYGTFTHLYVDNWSIYIQHGL